MRSYLLLAAALTLVGSVGCNDKKTGIEATKEPTPGDSAAMDSGVYSTDAGGTPSDPGYAANTGTPYEYSASDTGAPLNASGAASIPPRDSVASTHVVQKGDTLYRLARQYYNNQSRWKDIFEANRDQLSDPHRLKVGQTLTIP